MNLIQSCKYINVTSKGIWTPKKNSPESVKVLCDNHNKNSDYRHFLGSLNYIALLENINKGLMPYDFYMKHQWTYLFSSFFDDNGKTDDPSIEDERDYYEAMMVYEDEESYIKHLKDYLKADFDLKKKPLDLFLDAYEEEYNCDHLLWRSKHKYKRLKVMRKLFDIFKYVSESSSRLKDSSLNNMGACLVELGNYKEAADIFRMSKSTIAKQNLLGLFYNGKVKYTIQEYLSLCDYLIKKKQSDGYLVKSYLLQENTRCANDQIKAFNLINKSLDADTFFLEDDLIFEKGYLLENGIGTDINLEESKKYYKSIMDSNVLAECKYITLCAIQGEVPNGFSDLISLDDMTPREINLLEKLKEDYFVDQNYDAIYAICTLITVYSLDNKYKDEEQVKILKQKLINFKK